MNKRERKMELEYFQETLGRGADAAKKTPVEITCKKCGSENVFRDGHAEWNYAKQHWELSYLFDSAYCQDCDDDNASLEEITL